MKKYIQVYWMTLVIGVTFCGMAFADCGADKAAGSASSCCATKSSAMCASHGKNNNAKMNFGPKHRTK